MNNNELYFTSSRFNIVEGEEDDTNPGRFGKELGTWLCDHLKSRGYPDVELIPEDFGWCVMCSRQPFMLWACCGSMPTDEIMNSTIDNPPDIEKIVWTVFPVAEIPFFYLRSHILNLFGKIKMDPARQKLQKELRDILESASDIHFTEDPK